LLRATTFNGSKSRLFDRFLTLKQQFFNASFNKNQILNAHLGENLGGKPGTKIERIFPGISTFSPTGSCRMN
jgi:hypothetical protein